jgi:hypothetical protein
MLADSFGSSRWQANSAYRNLVSSTPMVDNKIISRFNAFDCFMCLAERSLSTSILYLKSAINAYCCDEYIVAGTDFRPAYTEFGLSKKTASFTYFGFDLR